MAGWRAAAAGAGRTEGRVNVLLMVTMGGEKVTLPSTTTHGSTYEDQASTPPLRDQVVNHFAVDRYSGMNCKYTVLFLNIQIRNKKFHSVLHTKPSSPFFRS